MTQQEETLLKQIFKKATDGGYNLPEGIPQNQPDNVRLHITRSLVLSPQFLEGFFGIGTQRQDNLWHFPMTPNAPPSPNFLQAWQFHAHKMVEMKTRVMQYLANWLDHKDSIPTIQQKRQE